MKNIVPAFALLALLALSSCARPGQLTARSTSHIHKTCDGFVRSQEGLRLFWTSRFPIRFQIPQSMPSDHRTAIESAMTTWNEALKADVFSISGEASVPAVATADGKNLIAISETWRVSSRPAQAETVLHHFGGIIREVDIVLNGQDFEFSVSPKQDQMDLESMMVRELGRSLGLELNSDSDSAMVPLLSMGQTSRQVTVRDVNRVLCQYGVNAGQ